MRKFLPILGLVGLLGFTACTDHYGNPDPLATGLLGAGIGAAAGLAISSSAPRYHAPPRHYGRPHYAPRHHGRHHHHHHRAPRRHHWH